MVGIVVTTSPSFMWYRIVVLPAADRATGQHDSNSSIQTQAHTIEPDYQHATLGRAKRLLQVLHDARHVRKTPSVASRVTTTGAACKTGTERSNTAS